MLKDFMIYIVAILTITLTIKWVLDSTPHVKFDFADNRCVQVFPKTAGSCDNLPGNYSHQFIGDF